MTTKEKLKFYLRSLLIFLFGKLRRKKIYQVVYIGRYNNDQIIFDNLTSKENAIQLAKKFNEETSGFGYYDVLRKK